MTMCDAPDARSLPTGILELHASRGLANLLISHKLLTHRLQCLDTGRRARSRRSTDVDKNGVDKNGGIEVGVGDAGKDREEKESVCEAGSSCGRSDRRLWVSSVSVVTSRPYRDTAAVAQWRVVVGLNTGISSELDTGSPTSLKASCVMPAVVAPSRLRPTH
eukprot:Selendium_serpulae@DN7305_c0_g1_i1.p1